VRVRAVAVVIERDELLVIRRRKGGREYTVLPGGGVETGESPEEACLRELYEETGLRGVVWEALRVEPDETGPTFYFRVTVDCRAVNLGGPELSRVSPDNRYDPGWIALNSLDLVNLVPEAAIRAIAAARKQPQRKDSARGSFD
jgi:8-oxo-dGTP diphosphatase